jgi:flagellar P-ring protein precursor FlgI
MEPGVMDRHTNARKSPSRLISLALLTLLTLAGSAQAVQIRDVVRIKGSETSKLTGMGLVVGLNGTGDGGDFLPAMRPLAEVIGRLMDPNVVASELQDAQNVALVALSAELPRSGVREGDRVDVEVSSVGPAESLEGGRLFMVPMIGPQKNSPTYAFAEGAVTIEDPDTPTVGVVKDGAQLTRDVMAQYLDEGGRLQLVVNQANASWPVAHNIANRINGLMVPDGSDIAQAADQKNIVVQVPTYERKRPAGFISQILQIYLDPAHVSNGARVVINEKTGTIVVSGDVQISPVIISHKGLTITTLTGQGQDGQQGQGQQPNAGGANQQNQQQEQRFIKLDPKDRGGTDLANLLDAFNRLKVDAQDRIEILKLMEKSGKLHGQLVME